MLIRPGTGILCWAGDQLCYQRLAWAAVWVGGPLTELQLVTLESVLGTVPLSSEKGDGLFVAVRRQETGTAIYRSRLSVPMNRLQRASPGDR